VQGQRQSPKKRYGWPSHLGTSAQRDTKGGAAQLSTSIPLPTEGTFAARVRFDGPIADEANSSASVKGFFTYYNAGPCIHMEHDFELFTGRSQVYQRELKSLLELSNTPNVDVALQSLLAHSPVMTTGTFARESTCGSTAPFRYIGTQVGIRDTINYGKKDVKDVILLITNKCEQPCDPNASTHTYTTKGWAVVDGVPMLWGTMTPTHDYRANHLTALFNVWWMQPAENEQLLDTKPNQDQTLEVDWFYWTTTVAADQGTALLIAQRGEACNNAKVQAGPTATSTAGVNKCR
jgi:hypothetical protein